MRRLFTLVLACAVCTVASDSWGRGVMRRFPGAAGDHARGAAAGVSVTPTPEPSNVIDTYSWDIAYSAHEATATTWVGSPGPTLEALDTPTLNLSTAGLTTIGGIGSARENKAVRAGAGGAFRATAAYDVPGGVYHLRALIYYNASSGSNEYLFYLYDYSTRLARLYRHTNGNLYFYTYFGGGNAFSTQNNTGTPAENAWHLVDIVYDGTGGPGGVSRVKYFLDGVEGSEQINGTAVDMIQPNADVNILGIGANGSSSVDAVFMGRRTLTSFDDFTLVQHQADVAALGL